MSNASQKCRVVSQLAQLDTEPDLKLVEEFINMLLRRQNSATAPAPTRRMATKAYAPNYEGFGGPCSRERDSYFWSESG
jgi:hypothetical protein